MSECVVNRRAPPRGDGAPADDAAALLDALDATPAVIVARSYGGEMATDLALRHPDRVRALVLLEARAGAPAAGGGGVDP